MAARELFEQRDRRGVGHDKKPPAAGVTAAPVYDIGQFLEDPHVQQRGIVIEAPDADMGEVPMHAVVADEPGERLVTLNR